MRSTPSTIRRYIRGLGYSLLRLFFFPELRAAMRPTFAPGGACLDTVVELPGRL
jgi:hypothetical protein